MVVMQLKKDHGEMDAFVLGVALFNILAVVFAQKIPRDTKGATLRDTAEPPPQLARRGSFEIAPAPQGALLIVLFLTAAVGGAAPRTMAEASAADFAACARSCCRQAAWCRRASSSSTVSRATKRCTWTV
jgi:hypothetical protein